MESLAEKLRSQCGREIKECSDRELYQALLSIVQKEALKRESNEGKKKIYYISAEFLIGKLLSNNLINLGWYDEARDVLAAAGKDLSQIER